jgi:hypothetical protein
MNELVHYLGLYYSIDRSYYTGQKYIKLHSNFTGFDIWRYGYHINIDF